MGFVLLLFSTTGFSKDAFFGVGGLGFATSFFGSTGFLGFGLVGGLVSSFGSTFFSTTLLEEGGGLETKFNETDAESLPALV
ncbi:hypothetical protein FORC36_3329 [Vibrio vulnificus]|nr:hypothetical protein FORC36_3329 [Vibrio vulnificus]